MRFTGTFTPPAMGREIMPIKLVGIGYIEVTADGLKVSGFHGSSWGQGIRALLYLIASVLLGVILYRLYGFSDVWFRLLVAVSVFRILVLLLRPLHQTTGKAWEFTVPWRNIVWMRPDPNDGHAVLFRVRGFRPAGLLHFVPDVPRDNVLSSVTTSGWFLPPTNSLWNRAKAYLRY